MHYTHVIKSIYEIQKLLKNLIYAIHVRRKIIIDDFQQ